ncbi:putative nucleotidyltransferase substrate binding domain-containing protein [Kineosporia sp. A_224]|uniref:putative nucleotidyltransferase substrate binding domain-containing protein n=1 Tax=Kineosporia sp. A_224 TaxID=1962180 RepID=UPI0013046051|nr:putative nucleotidyltransferase substrate binding domain-containing protein [Kineosporia sp. A_224]
MHDDLVHDTVAFLRGFPPFDGAPDDALRAVAAAVVVEHVPAGTLIVAAGGPGDGAVRVLRTGHADLLADGRVVDVLGEGELVGLPSAVSGLPPGLDVRAAEDVVAYRLPADAILPLLAGRSGLRFLARTVRERTPPAGTAPVTDGGPGAVGPLARAVVVAAAADPLRDVVAAMHDRDASCVLVRTADGHLGIVTDRDLRTRVVATGRSVSDPVGEVATVPAVTVAPDATTDDAVLALLTHGFRHLPVVGAGGEVLGVVEDRDLLAAQSRTPVRLRRAVSRAATPAALVEAARGMRPALLAAVGAGMPPGTVTGTLGALVEAVVARAVELHVAARGVPPVPFAWLVTGSVARGEAVLSSDLDSLLAWEGDDTDPDVRRWMRGLAAEVLTTLGACGLDHDVNGVRADDPRFSRSVGAWCSAVAGWAGAPTENQAEIYLSALADARPVRGHATWAPVSGALRSAHARPAVRATAHRVATALHPPTGFVRGLVIESGGEHAGTVDLKRGGAGPVVAAGRYLATLLPAPPAGTAARLRAAAVHGLLRDDEARDLADALHVVQGTRLHHQADQVRRGDAPDDHLRPDELTTLERRGLRDAFRVVARVQRALPPPVARP